MLNPMVQIVITSKSYYIIMLIRKKLGNLSLLLKLSRNYHNLYEVLGVEHGADQQEIKAKYY